MTLRRKSVFVEALAWDLSGSDTWYRLYTKSMRETLDAIEKKIPGHIIITDSWTTPKRGVAAIEGHVKKKPELKFQVELRQQEEGTKHRVTVTMMTSKGRESESDIFNATLGRRKAVNFVMRELKWLK